MRANGGMVMGRLEMMGSHGARSNGLREWWSIVVAE